MRNLKLPDDDEATEAEIGLTTLPEPSELNLVRFDEYRALWGEEVDGHHKRQRFMIVVAYLFALNAKRRPKLMQQLYGQPYFTQFTNEKDDSNLLLACMCYAFNTKAKGPEYNKATTYARALQGFFTRDEPPAVVRKALERKRISGLLKEARDKKNKPGGTPTKPRDELSPSQVAAMPKAMTSADVVSERVSANLADWETLKRLAIKFEVLVIKVEKPLLAKVLGLEEDDSSGLEITRKPSKTNWLDLFGTEI